MLRTINLQPKHQPTSSRILYDIPCRVCQDHSSGKHYGIFACDGCAGFFKRSIRRNRQYICKAKIEGSCLVDKTHRNQCRACRLTKCIQVGMNKEAVQHERGPRNSTLRRQMAHYMKEQMDGGGSSETVAESQEPGGSLPTESTHTAPSAHHHIQPSTAPHHHFYPQLHKVPEVVTPLGNLEDVCESAARLLFMNVRWAKNVPAFTALPIKDQLVLLEESWRELFLLGCAQLLPPLDLSGLLAANIGSGSSSSGSHPAITLFHEAATFQQTLAKLRTLQLDHHEFACLRAILLFKTAFEGEGNTLVDVAGVAALQDHCQVTLSKYITAAYPDQPFRFGKVLLLLPTLRAVSSDTIEELFFRRTTGPIPIRRIISDMYKSNRDI